MYSQNASTGSLAMSIYLNIGSDPGDAAAAGCGAKAGRLLLYLSRQMSKKMKLD